MSVEQARQRAQAWLAPLAGDSPFGADARYLPEHELVRAEVAKLDAPGGAPVDWKKVISAGSRLLSSQSKDWLVAAYLAQALHEEEALPGLLSGVHLLNGLLDAAWDGMYPPVARLKARAGALQWFVERASLRLQAGGEAGEPCDPTHVEALDAELQRLAELARSRFADAVPALTPLKTALERRRLNGSAASAATPAANGGEAAAESSAAPDASAAESDTPPSAASGEAAASDTPDLASQRSALVGSMQTWLLPISEQAPAGKDARFDPLHEETRAFIKQLDSPTGKPFEWKKLLGNAETILRQRSKDLLIGTYAAYGLYQQQALPGLATGLALVASLLDGYWDTLFPDMQRSQKARSAALAWLLSRLTTLGDREVSAEDAADIAQLSVATAWLVEVISARFDPDHRPAVQPLLDQVGRLELGLAALSARAVAGAQKKDAQASKARVRSEAAADKPAAVGGQATAISVPQAVAAPGEVSNRAELTRFLASVHSSLADSGRALRKALPKDPLGYLLPRVGAALELDEEPPSQNGRTMIPAPDAGETAEIRGLFQEGNWEALLMAAELASANNPLFLDMHRLAHSALAQLGEGYSAAKLVVESELAALLRRLPGVLELSFSNGTPFADAQTRDFIRSQILAVSGAGAGGGGGGGTEASGLDAEALAAARSKAIAGNKLEALQAFEALVRQAHSGRTRFRVRMAMAQAALLSGDRDLSAGLFSTLYDELERRGLDDWEPELAAECLASYHECLVALMQDGRDGREMAQRSALVYARLCRVDPGRALKLSR